MLAPLRKVKFGPLFARKDPTFPYSVECRIEFQFLTMPEETHTVFVSKGVADTLSLHEIRDAAVRAGMSYLLRRCADPVRYPSNPNGFLDDATVLSRVLLDDAA